MVRFGSKLVAALALCTALPALAQINPSLSEFERGIRTGDEPDVANRLSIREMAVAAKVDGQTADVTVELLIASASDAPFEADLVFQLPDDAVVTGYALNVGDRMIPGVLLEAPKARNVYDDTVRQGIDPGLAEMMAGNRFRTRIFPVSRQLPRRFRLTFAAPFDPENGLVLPFARDEAISAISVAVSGSGLAKPMVSFGGRPIVLTQSRDSWAGSDANQRGPLREGLVITGASTGLSLSQHDNGERMFTLFDRSALLTDTAAMPKRPGVLRIYWDRSRSHRDARTDREAEALVRLVDQLRPAAIDLVSFASDTPVVNRLTSAADLRAALGSITYRGASSLAGLDALQLPAASHCVMVSDGQLTIDRQAAFNPDCRLSIISAASNADGARLARLAQKQGGRFIRLGEGQENAVAGQLANASPAVVSLTDSSGTRLDFRSLSAPAGGFHLVGPMRGNGTITARFSDGREVIYSSTEAPARVNAAAALWAAQRVVELGDDPARQKDMAAFSRRFNVAGPAMSFLVLERPDQYLEADIRPPEGFPDAWMADYRMALKSQDDDRTNDRRERLDYVVEQWRNRQEWWRNPPIRKPDRNRSEDGAEDGQMADMPAPTPLPPVMAPPPSPPPPPPRPAPAAQGAADAAEAAADYESDASDVIVTAARSRDQAEPVATDRRQPAVSASVNLPEILSKTPYLAALDAAAPADRLRVLAEQDTAYGTIPAFYLDTAEWFRLKGDRATATALLLSALDLPTSDDETKQIVAFRLERDGAHDRAVELAEALAAVNAEFRPQPGRSLAMALAARGRAKGRAGRADLERAFSLLTDAALNPASSDFDGIEVIALMEANALIPAIEAAGGSWQLDPRLVGLLDTDLRIVIEWTADDADIDLWVDEPHKERVFYGNTDSAFGGLISNDMTDGYGPEEYVIRRARRGQYQVRINGFDADRINPNGAGHVLMRIIRDFARPTARQQLIDADLSFQKGRNRDNQDGAKPVATIDVEQ